MQVSFNGRNSFFKSTADIAIGNANPQQFAQLRKFLGPEKAAKLQNASGRIDAKSVTSKTGLDLLAKLGDVAKFNITA